MLDIGQPHIAKVFPHFTHSGHDYEKVVMSDANRHAAAKLSAFGSSVADQPAHRQNNMNIGQCSNGLCQQRICISFNVGF